MNTYKTYQPKEKDIKRNWHKIDAKGQVLGRIATQMAKFLMGKHKVSYAPHLDNGDFVVVVNAEKVKVTGNKEKDKMYYRHSGYPGGFKALTFAQVMEKNPIKIIEHAVNNMVSKNRLRDPRLRRLKVFIGEKHPYRDQLKETEVKS